MLRSDAVSYNSSSGWQESHDRGQLTKGRSALAERKRSRIYRDVATRDARAMRCLKDRMESAVDEFKSRGRSVERIMIRVKEVAAETGVSTRVDPSGRDDTIVSDAIRWCIGRYYAET